MSYKLVVCDMDGKLLTSQHRISDYTADIIKKIEKKGVKFLIATGRPFLDAKHYRDTLNLSSFLSINYFNDPSTGAEHGKILLKILIQKGDSSFFKALKLANHVELSNIKAYMLIGIYNQERDIDYYITSYPKSFAYLQIDHW